MDNTRKIVLKLDESIVNENRKLSRRLMESAGFNPGNLLIGQAVKTVVTDLVGKEFERDMTVELVNADGLILLRDNITKNVYYLQWDETPSTDTLHYYSIEDNGIKVDLYVDKEALSNSTIAYIND